MLQGTKRNSRKSIERLKKNRKARKKGRKTKYTKRDILQDLPSKAKVESYYL